MLYRLRNIFIIMLITNIIIIYNLLNISTSILVICSFFLFFMYLYINVKPLKVPNVNKRVKFMVSGYELIVDSSYSFALELLLYLSFIIFKPQFLDLKVYLINLLVFILLIILPFLNGFFRTIFTSRNLGVGFRILILLLWWVPVFNIIALRGLCKKVRYEYYYEQNKCMRNEARRDSEVCNTKYPVVMVHGIFFRDWMFINYWGRIPSELRRNGSSIYYGKQQSSNSVKKSAEELKQTIMKIIKDTGCEKVNIIAHSKGGLDARYAISCLGLSKYTASLTTINTPHRGCRYVDFLLEKIPDKIKSIVDNKYNKLFTKLGDKNPDFLSGVYDLTYKSCREFNETVLDSPDVYYQSITSTMKNMFSACFPLNLSYLLAKKFDGDNDGLVSISSAKWGNFLGVFNSDASTTKGVSHGDVIDMTRQDIKGFDVCELYINIIKDLKDRGL